MAGAVPAAPLPPDEVERLGALRALDVLYTPAEERFDRITRLASRLLDVPIALISLVDQDCQWFKSAQGLLVASTDRASSFCAHAIHSDEILVVPDATHDPRFANNPLVLGEPFIRAYAGQPILSDDGARLGTLCAIDTRARRFTPGDLQALRDLGAWVENEFRAHHLSEAQQALVRETDTLRRRALVDDLTRVWNRGAIEDVLRRELERSRRGVTPLAVIFLDLDHFKQVNDRWGHSAGDRVLADTAARLRSSCRPFDAIGRIGGEEFLVVLPRAGLAEAAVVAERFARALRERAFVLGDGVSLQVSISQGVVSSRGLGEEFAGELIAAADRALYRAKSEGRDRIVAGEELEAPPRD